MYTTVSFEIFQYFLKVEYMYTYRLSMHNFGDILSICITNADLTLSYKKREQKEFFIICFEAKRGSSEQFSSTIQCQQQGENNYK